jgi:DNA-binding MarR family transcriptional regulator
MSGTADSAEEALDALLATIQRGDLSPLELRILLWLADRVGTQPELATALDVSLGRVGRAATRLATRGLIGRRFERGRRSQFVLSITSAGLLAVAPLVEWTMAARAAPKSDVWQRAGRATAARPSGEAHD